MPISLASTSASSMHGAMVPIASVTFTGSTSDFNFTNIPQGYQDLLFVIYGRSDYASNDVLIQSYINGNFASNYSDTTLEGDGTSAYSSRDTNYGAVKIGFLPGGNSTSGIFGSMEYHILNYANSSTYKSTLSRSASDRNGSGKTGLFVSLWRSTAAITSVGVATYGVGNFVSGSTVTLYGVRTVGQ